MKLLFLPEKAIGLFHDRGVEVENSTRSSKRKRQNATYRYLSLPIKFLLLPSTLYKKAKKRGKTKELLFLIPAALIAILFAFVAYQKNFRSAGLQQRYLAKAKHAVSDNNLIMAKTYMARILQEQETLTDAQALHWVVILGRTGEEGQAEQILQRIAPTDAEGYPPAHRFAAIEMVRLHQSGQAELDSDLLKWHLEHSSKMDAELKSAWSAYYVSKNQPEKAVELLEEAAETYPQLYLATARLCKEHGFDDRRINALRRAEAKFRSEIKEQPLNQFSRISLVSALSQLEKLDEAEVILKSGLSLQETPVLRRTLSDLYVLGYDKAKKKNADFGRQMLFLKNAIATDVEAVIPYHRLVALTSNLLTDEAREELREELASVATSSLGGPTDHCNLAYLCWQESDQDSVQWHLDQAWRIDPNFGERAHRLALAFAQSRKSPDLDWSARIAGEVVSKQPGVAAFHESRGEIFMIRTEYKNALDELKLSLNQSKEPAMVHRKLAVVYNELGESRLSQIHSRKAAEGDIKLVNDEK